jgi:hypothetical protein
MEYPGVVSLLYIFRFSPPPLPFVSPVASLGAVAALPVGAAALLCSMVVASTIDFGQGNPFTAQEWMWALKGGYLDDMMSHYLQNGGM